MEAEYVALANAVQESLFLQQLLETIDIKVKVDVKIDNQSCMQFAKNCKGPGRSAKHISVKFYFVKDTIEKNEVSLAYVPSSENAADVFTKALCKVKMQKAMKMLEMLRSDI